MVASTLHDQAAARLREADQRYTGNRRALVDLLDRVGRPVPIPEILKAGRALPQSSVYRNLSVLEAAGVVRRVLGVDEFARYELAEDLTEHHHHLVCTACGDVNDVQLSPRLERSVERAIEEIASSAGFRLGGHRLDLVGTCANCS
jgi:Fe2+ or Zn2+ uptake regulation protein